MGIRFILIIALNLTHYPLMAADSAPKYTADDIKAIIAVRCADLSDQKLKTCQDQIWREYSPAGTSQSLGPCDDAKRKFEESNQAFGKACPANRKATTKCEQQAEMCISECKTVDGKTDPLCSKENDRDILKETRTQKEASIKAKQMGVTLAKPRATDKLYYCPPYAGGELVKINKDIKEQKDEVQTLEDDITELKEKLSTGEDSIEGQLSDLEVNFKEELEKAKNEYDEALEKIDSAAKEKESDLSDQFQKNVEQIEIFKLELKNLENQRVAALRKEGELTCLKKGQDCVDAKIAERTMLLKTNKLQSRGGLLGTLNNTGKKLIEKNCTSTYNQCLKNPSTTAILEAINRQFNLQAEDTHRKIQNLIQQNASVVSKLKEIDPEKTKAREKTTEKYQKKTESLRTSFNAKHQQLQKAKAALEQQIKTKELRLVEEKSIYTVDMAYSKAAEKAFGGQADDDAAQKYKDYMAAYGELQRAASNLELACPGETLLQIETFRSNGGSTSRGTSQ